MYRSWNQQFFAIQLVVKLYLCVGEEEVHISKNSQLRVFIQPTKLRVAECQRKRFALFRRHLTNSERCLGANF